MLGHHRHNAIQCRALPQRFPLRNLRIRPPAFQSSRRCRSASSRTIGRRSLPRDITWYNPPAISILSGRALMPSSAREVNA
jgi:hypothetical protein